MPFVFAPFGRATFLVCLLAALVAGCGRRGPLESPSASAEVAAPRATRNPEPARARSGTDARPPGASAQSGGGSIGTRPAAPIGRSGSLSSNPQAALQDATDDESSDAEDPTVGGFSAAPTPTARKRPRAFVIPSEPFVLDPLL